MDAFVVLTKDQYIKLTSITPTFSTPYTIPETYTLNQGDTKNIQKIYTTLQTYIKKNGEKQKRKFISLLRSAVSSKIIKDDVKKLAIIKNILQKLYSIQQLQK
jgi:hypothetical protein